MIERKPVIDNKILRKQQKDFNIIMILQAYMRERNISTIRWTVKLILEAKKRDRHTVTSDRVINELVYIFCLSDSNGRLEDESDIISTTINVIPYEINKKLHSVIVVTAHVVTWNFAINRKTLQLRIFSSSLLNFLRFFFKQSTYWYVIWDWTSNNNMTYFINNRDTFSYNIMRADVFIELYQKCEQNREIIKVL